MTLDAVIFGGGAAGLWLLDELLHSGRNALLLEAHELGAGQTVASQGIIHGGLKYTLSGLFTPSAKAISEMPLIWRRCLAGEGRPDLSGTRIRSEFCYLWRTSSLSSRLAMIGARAGLRVAPTVIRSEERPGALANCPGTVARLDEQVIEPASLVNELREHHRPQILKIDAEHGLEFDASDGGVVQVVRLINPDSGEPLDLRPRHVILTAGGGNAELRRQIGLSADAMQRRPLHMVLVRGNERLPMLNGHCVDGSTTRITITSTRDYSERTIWQVGGRIAEVGVGRTGEELAALARRELEAVLPGVGFDGLEWATYEVDRAEPATRGGIRPDTAFAQREGSVITAWPTKLALVPEMVRRVMAMLDTPLAHDAMKREDPVPRNWPQPIVALPPWETATRWFRDV